MKARLKVLVSAYACSPYKGSEPGVGWGFVAALAEYHDLWVIVEEEKFRDDIERYLADNSDFSERVRFHFIRKQRNRLLRKVWPPSYYWYYRRWHEAAFLLGKDLHAQVGFDLAHQLTMVGFREPGNLWELGIPFVWGPVGGMGIFPWRFLSHVGIYGAFYYFGYNFINLWQMRFALRPKLAAQHSGIGLIAATPENQRGAARYWRCSSTLLSEVGLPPITANLPSQRASGEALRIVWTGMHSPGKALNLGLYALAALPRDEVSWELHILGTGRRTKAWRCLSKRLGLADRCHFHGFVPRGGALKIMASAHLLLITSLRDLTSTVTIEALALGLPIVCFDHCGFSSVIDHSCGIKIPVTTPEDTVKRLASAVRRLAFDEGARRRLGQGAINRARDFSWENKARVVDDIYRRLLSRRDEVDS